MQSTTIRCSSLVHSQVLVFRIALKRFHFADGDSVTFKVMIFYSHVFSALSPNLKLMRFVFGCHFSKQFYSSSRSGNCLKLNQVFIPENGRREEKIACTPESFTNRPKALQSSFPSDYRMQLLSSVCVSADATCQCCISVFPAQEAQRWMLF